VCGQPRGNPWCDQVESWRWFVHGWRWRRENPLAKELAVCSATLQFYDEGFPNVRLAGRSAQEASARPSRNNGAKKSAVRPQAASEATAPDNSKTIPA